MDIAGLFESRKNDPRWNTSYPLNPADWAIYRNPGTLPFDRDKRLSFYIHIPFCKHLCSFCEYTRILCPNEQLQKKYINAVANDIRQFKNQYNDFTLLGFDIGGGTPTALSDTSFYSLLDVYDEAIAGLSLSDTFEPSIEATFNTLSNNKLSRLTRSNIRRLSLGIQSSCESILKNYSRSILFETKIKEWLKKAWDAGIKKINLDLMYGLEGQNTETIACDLNLIAELQPQQVSLYELRTNMIPCKNIPSKAELYNQYLLYYEGLTKMGYNACFGQNTFSVFNEDFGVSSYLRERMLNGASYKGFGISAQSMSSVGLSYNKGKVLSVSSSLLSAQSYPEEYTYILPNKELAAKYMAISAYSGSFSLERLKMFGVNNSILQEILSFCMSEGLLRDNGHQRFNVTKKGFKHYGALFSLFYDL